MLELMPKMPKRMRDQLHILRWTGWLKILAVPVVLLGLRFSIPLFAAFFQPGEESFIALLRDPNHLLFEAITGISQTVVVDVLLLAVVWPLVKRHIHKDINKSHGERNRDPDLEPEA